MKLLLVLLMALSAQLSFAQPDFDPSKVNVIRCKAIASQIEANKKELAGLEAQLLKELAKPQFAQNKPAILKLRAQINDLKSKIASQQKFYDDHCKKPDLVDCDKLKQKISSLELEIGSLSKELAELKRKPLAFQNKPRIKILEGKIEELKKQLSAAAALYAKACK